MTCLSSTEVDEAGFWDEVYKTQTERDIYEWYGLGDKLSDHMSARHFYRKPGREPCFLGYEQLRPHFLEALRPASPESRKMKSFEPTAFGAGDCSLSAAATLR